MVVVPSTVTTLSDYADQLLGVCAEALATTTGGVPDRVYVSPSNPAFDCCPFLSVVVAGLEEAGTSPIAPIEVIARRGDFGNIILAAYTIWSLRCAPTAIEGTSLPSVTDIALVAAQVQEDGWALWNAIRHAHADGEIFDGCLGVHFDGGQPIPEQGGCVGWLFRIRASIEGIPNP